METKEFIFKNEVEAVATGPGVTRRIMGYDKDVMLVSVEFEAGGVGAEHKHPHVQTTYVASGRFEVTIGSETKTLSVGDGFFAPSDKPHGVNCLEAGVLVDVFSPMREDFLK